MQRARHDFLAGAGFAKDQHVGLGSGQGADLFAQASHGRRVAEQTAGQLLAVGQGQAQAAVVQHQTAQRQRAAHRVEQRLAGKGFFEEVVGAGAHRLHRELHVAMAGDQQHRQVGIAALQVGQQLQAVDARHADIADHHAVPVGRQTCLEGARVLQAGNLEPGEIERLAQRLAQVRIVVDQHHLGPVVDTVVAAHCR